MNSNFDTSKYRFEELPRKEQELLVIDSQLNGVEIEFWGADNVWVKASTPRWHKDRRYRRKPELLEQHVNVYLGFTKAYPTSDIAEEAARQLGVDVVRVAVHMREVSDE